MSNAITEIHSRRELRFSDGYDARIAVTTYTNDAAASMIVWDGHTHAIITELTASRLDAMIGALQEARTRIGLPHREAAAKVWKELEPGERPATGERNTVEHI